MPMVEVENPAEAEVQAKRHKWRGASIPQPIFDAKKSSPTNETSPSLAGKAVHDLLANGRFVDDSKIQRGPSCDKS